MEEVGYSIRELMRYKFDMHIYISTSLITGFSTNSDDHLHRIASPFLAVQESYVPLKRAGLKSSVSGNLKNNRKEILWTESK